MARTIVGDPLRQADICEHCNTIRWRHSTDGKERCPGEGNTTFKLQCGTDKKNPCSLEV